VSTAKMAALSVARAAAAFAEQYAAVIASVAVMAGCEATRGVVSAGAALARGAISCPENVQQLSLRDAEPDTLRYRIWSIPARLARHARKRILKISPDWPWKDAFITCWNRLCALPAPS